MDAGVGFMTADANISLTSSRRVGILSTRPGTWANSKATCPVGAFWSNKFVHAIPNSVNSQRLFWRKIQKFGLLGGRAILGKE